MYNENRVLYPYINIYVHTYTYLDLYIIAIHYVMYNLGTMYVSLHYRFERSQYNLTRKKGDEYTLICYTIFAYTREG